MIEITKTEGSSEFLCRCPYTKKFVEAAKMRGGKWSDSLKRWIFDIRDEMAIRGTLVDIYGTDDYATCQKRTVRINLDDFSTNGNRLVLCGREVAKRRESWQKVWLGEGVVLLEGGFADEPRQAGVYALPGTTIEVRDVPQMAAENLFTKHPDHVVIIGGIDREALLLERESLLRRVADIETLLADKPEEDEIIADLQD